MCKIAERYYEELDLVAHPDGGALATKSTTPSQSLTPGCPHSSKPGIDEVATAFIGQRSWCYTEGMDPPAGVRSLDPANSIGLRAGCGSAWGQSRVTTMSSMPFTVSFLHGFRAARRSSGVVNCRRSFLQTVRNIVRTKEWTQTPNAIWPLEKTALILRTSQRPLKLNGTFS